MVAALREPLEDSDDDNEDNMEAEGDGPLWQLFDQLHNTANAAGKLTYFQLTICVPSFILIFLLYFKIERLCLAFGSFLFFSLFILFVLVFGCFSCAFSLHL